MQSAQHQACWSLLIGYLKLNFDGASITNAFWRWGFVLRNHLGDVVLVSAKHNYSPIDAATEEARACMP